MIRLALVLVLLACAGGAQPAPQPAPQAVVADLSQSRVAITAGFHGSEIVVFGAVRPGDPDDPPDVIVTVEGPRTPVTVWRKARVAGIWINRTAIDVDQAPTLYKVAGTRALPDILSETEDLRHRITVARAIRAVGATESTADAARFVEALMRIRAQQGLYSETAGAVTMLEGTLFRTTIALPANLTEGAYRTRIFLLRDRQVIASFEREIDVGKVGLERWLFGLAHDRPLIYGLLSLGLAIAAGWGASALFRAIRG